ncbi:MAG: response regulator transcription factor [Anaerolineae bacterium]|nr:response regulator transcription factor [Anaerolineae bacterium]
MLSPTSILVVDDEPDLLENISLPLEVEGFQVHTAPDGLQALEILEDQTVSLILADIAMPNMNGYQLYEKVRENPRWITIPFIFLSARTMDTDIHYGKELGVDDYLTKPIRGPDLLAAVRGKLRRAEQIITTIGQYNFTRNRSDKELVVGPLRIDSEQHRVWLEDEELKLSAREFILLEELAAAGGKVLSPQKIIEATHDYKTDNIEAGNLLRPLILSLRRKLGIESEEIGSVENVRGVGYRLIVPE